MNTEQYKAWLLTHIPALKEIPANELEIVAHTLVHHTAFEEFVHLNLGASSSVVICLERPNADEEILKHYAESRLGVSQYNAYVSDSDLTPYGKKLRVTRLVFAALSGKEEMLPGCEELAKKAVDSDAVCYTFEHNVLAFAWKNVNRRNFLHRLVGTCRRYGLKVAGLRLAYNKPLSAKCIVLGRLTLEGNTKDMLPFFREFELLKNYKVDSLDCLIEKGLITGNDANLLRAYTSLIGQILVDVDAAMYTEDNIIEAFSSQVSLTIDLLKMFELKFFPAKFDMTAYKKLAAEFEAKLKTLDTGMKKLDDRRRVIFGQALNVTQHILRTNHYDIGKIGTGFRLDANYLEHVPGLDRPKLFPEVPFSIYFVKGRQYFAFQVRFRDLARGGLRTIVSWNPEHELNERGNMFKECYGLAFTQQKKNKDIPEGGSKAICFVSANEELAKEEELVAHEMRLSGAKEEAVAAAVAEYRKEQSGEYMYYNQRSFLTTFLKMFIWDHEKNELMYTKNSVDHLKVPEYIYLGPDENFHDYLIGWLAAESVRLGYYPVGGAFISGKDKVGVNHKEFGVTSWGVHQFMARTIEYKGITGKFTVKITGGPDGDVAGNCMLLLKKYYADRAIVKVITDGSGTAYDPEGFCLESLEHMFHKCQMMQDFPREKLHNGGWVLCMKITRQPTPLTKEVLMVKKVDGKVVEEWISFSEGNKLWATEAHVVPTDVFLPCGGRPRALNMTNIDTVLINGKPTFDIVAEGANLYITPDAREFLEDKGVLLMRDSSANKCGVISSSYEILGGLSMADEDFVKAKPELAKNILARLEQVANEEARCMIAYHKLHEGKIRMTKISEIVSAKINRFTDDIAAFLKPLDLNRPENKYLLDVFITYLPECIRKTHMERAMKRIPEMHKKAVIATRIACHIVYKKGLDWEPSVCELLPKIVAEL